MPRQPCHLCDAGFEDRASLLEHIAKEHGGLQKYRNAMLCLQSFCPHVVAGSEVRYYVSNYSTFLRHASMDWEGPCLTELRGGRGCAFCARWFWLEEMWAVHLAGEQCFMHEITCSLDALVCGSIPSALAEDPFDSCKPLASKCAQLTVPCSWRCCTNAACPQLRRAVRNLSMFASIATKPSLPRSRGSASLLSPTISGLDASIHCCGRPT